MSGLLNLFKKLISGIFGFLGGLVGGKSKGGFYLELKDDVATAAPAKAAAPVVAAPVKAVAAPAKAVAAPAAAPAAVSAKPGKASKSAGKSTRAEKLAALAAEGQANGSAPMVTAAAATLNLPQPTVVQAPKEPEIKTFADKYLVPMATPSRRPGANMSSFLTMARQVNKTAG